MIDLACVASFLEVATSGSFRLAAQRIGLSQPTVTQHIRKLERSLNAELIDRINAGSALTPQGRAFLPYAQTLVRTSERARTMFRNRSIAVGASSNIGVYLLPAYLKACKEKLGLEIDLVIDDNPGIAKRIQNLEIDVALMEWWEERSGFVAERWKQEQLVVIVPPNHPWASMKSIPSALLQGVSLLGGESGSGTGRLLKQCLGDQADSLQRGMQLGSTEAVKRAVRAGLGISIVMASAVHEEQEDGRLRAIPLSDIVMQKDVYLVRHASAEDGSVVQFTDFLLSSS